jgi:hypothetical protein
MTLEPGGGKESTEERLESDASSSCSSPSLISSSDFSSVCDSDSPASSDLVVRTRVWNGDISVDRSVLKDCILTALSFSFCFLIGRLGDSGDGVQGLSS